MRTKSSLLVLSFLLALMLGAGSALAGCGSEAVTTTTAPATTSSTAGPGGVAPIKIEVPLTGAEVVPPVQTAASGTLLLFVEATPSGSYNISYELNVKDIVDVTAAHVHLASKGAEGEVIFPLFTGPEKAGSFTGELAKGTFEAKDLTGPMAGKTIPDLAAAVLGGQTYVNVHTKAHPNGEIRGQITVSLAGASPETTGAGGGATPTSSGSVY